MRTFETIQTEAFVESFFTGSLARYVNEKEFSFITQMAAQICETRIAVIVILNKEEQFLLSHVGLEEHLSFCSDLIIKYPESFKEHFIEIENVKTTTLFQNHSSFLNGAGISFFASQKLFNGGSDPIGMLCVMDNEPKKLSQKQQKLLKELGNQTVRLLELQHKTHTLQKLNYQLCKVEDLFNASQEISNIGAWEVDLETGKTFWTEQVYNIHEVEPGFDHDTESGINFYHPEDRPIISKALEDTIRTGEPFSVECRFISAKNNLKWVRSIGRKSVDTDGKPILVGVFQDITERKKEREELESFFKVNLDLLCIADLEGNFIKVNEAWQEVLGYSTSELKHHKFLEFVHPDDMYATLNAIADLGKGESVLNFINRYRSKDGSYRWIEWRSRPKDNLIFAAARDITERIQKENETTYQKELFNALFELSPIGIALNDFETGLYINVNAKLLEPTGYTKEEFLKLSYFQVTPEKYFPDEEKVLESLTESGIYGPFEKEYIRKDGTTYPILLRGVLIKDTNGKKLIWSFIQDISKEKEAERKLFEAINFLQTVLEAGTNVSIIATDTQGKITLFNKGAERLLGYSESEMVGQKKVSLLHLPSEINKIANELHLANGTDEDAFMQFATHIMKGNSLLKEWIYCRKNGSNFPVLLSITPILHQKEPIGMLGVAIDISELKNAEEEIKTLLQLSEDQNERLKNFAHIVSHNLRSHSAGLLGMLEILNLEDPETYANEYVQYLKKGTDNLQKTIEHLTEVVKNSYLENDELKILPLKPIIDRTIDSLISTSEKNKVQLINLVNDALYVRAIPAYLDSIIMNFMTNAIKYADLNKKSTLKISSWKVDNETVIQFLDNGLGIDLDKYGKHLFDLYKTFHNKSDSRGIGLHITKNQIEAMGGRIEVESKVGKGTTFRVYLKN